MTGFRLIPRCLKSTPSCSSFALAPTNPVWYYNLEKAREADIEVGTEKFHVRATPVASGPERDRLYEQHSTYMPGFRDYVTKTTRTIPVVVLERV
jgi:deazaflavin-dependent oxidoreductase (nitroreductase family)